MSNDQRYRVVGRTGHYHDGDLLAPGDEFVPTDGELRAFPDKFEPVDPPDDDDGEGSDDATTASDESDGSGAGDQSGDSEAPIDPADYTVDELAAELDSASYSDAELGAIREAETAGKDRETALDAIDDAREREA